MSTLIEKLERERKTHHDLMLQSPTLQDSAYYNGVTVGFMGAISVVKQHSDWISVDERLPNEDGECLVYVDATKFKGGKFIDMEFFKTSINAFCYFMGEAEVTHWQPLPHPPIEVKP